MFASGQSNERKVTRPADPLIERTRDNGGVTQPQRSFYDEVGGHQTFHAIVSRFYQLVREDEILVPLYPEDELDAAEERLRMFLEQYSGRPADLFRSAWPPATADAARPVPHRLH